MDAVEGLLTMFGLADETAKPLAAIIDLKFMRNLASIAQAHAN